MCYAGRVTHVVQSRSGRHMLGTECRHIWVAEVLACAERQPFAPLGNCVKRGCGAPLARHVSIDDHTKRCARAKGMVV